MAKAKTQTAYEKMTAEDEQEAYEQRKKDAIRKPQGRPKLDGPPPGEFEYCGQDGIRFMFRSRRDQKCYTVDKNHLEYRGEGDFRPELKRVAQF